MKICNKKKSEAENIVKHLPIPDIGNAFKVGHTSKIVISW